MKEAYEELKLEVIEFDGGDIITESNQLPEVPVVTSFKDSKAPDTTWIES